MCANIVNCYCSVLKICRWIFSHLSAVELRSNKISYLICLSWWHHQFLRKPTMMTTIWCLRQAFLRPSKSIHPMSKGYSMSLFYYFGRHSIHSPGSFALRWFCKCHLSWECHQNPLQFLIPESHCSRRLISLYWNALNTCPIDRHWISVDFLMPYTMASPLASRH